MYLQIQLLWPGNSAIPKRYNPCNLASGHQDRSAPGQNLLQFCPQFTNRRMRMFITTPSARKVNNTEDPP